MVDKKQEKKLRKAVADDAHEKVKNLPVGDRKEHKIMDAIKNLNSEEN